MQHISHRCWVVPAGSACAALQRVWCYQPRPTRRVAIPDRHAVACPLRTRREDKRVSSNELGSRVLTKWRVGRAIWGTALQICRPWVPTPVLVFRQSPFVVCFESRQPPLLSHMLDLARLSSGARTKCAGCCLHQAIGDASRDKTRETKTRRDSRQTL